MVEVAGRIRLLLFGLTALLATTQPAGAHEMNLARYRLDAGGGSLALSLTVPATFGRLRGDAGAVHWPEGCAETSREEVPLGALVRLTVRAQCATAPPPGAVVVAPWGTDGAVLESADGTLVLAARDGGVPLPLPGGPRGLGAVLVEYLELGVMHILQGWDHLAFVLCLALLAGGLGLLWLVTAFTIGHSASLALAYLEIVRIPAPPTEAAIALSIVFMAREALAVETARRNVDRRAILVVVLFGLLHGLGFASVLGDLGVATGERVTGLLAFNLGVEAGQLLFVAVLLAVGAGLRAARLEAQARLAMLGLAGCVGAYWFVERTAGLAG
jgi:hypothetical protein